MVKESRTSKSHPADDSGSPPSDAARSVVSVLLVIHLLIVFVALSSYVSPSSLQSRLLSLFSLYAEPLNLNLSSGGRSDARFYLTRTTTQDFPVELEIEVQGEAADAKVVLPNPDRSWGPRARREQALLSMYARFAQSEETAAILSTSIGAAVMAQHEVQRATIVCRRPKLRENTQQSGFMPAPLHDEQFEIMQHGKLMIILGKVNYNPIVLPGRESQAVPAGKSNAETTESEPPADSRSSSNGA